VHFVPRHATGDSIHFFSSISSSSGELPSSSSQSVPEPSLSYQEQPTQKVLREVASLCRDGKPEIAEEKVQTLKNVSVDVMNQILGAYASASGSSDALKDLLYRMKSDESLPSPNTGSYNILLSVLSPPEADKLLKAMIKNHTVDRWSFNTVMSSWAKSREANRAVSILNQMANHAEKTDNPALKPDMVSFSTVLTVFAQRGMAEEASLLLSRIQHLNPDKITLTSVILAWANSKRPDAPREALRVLEGMYRQYESERDFRIKPDTVAYNAVLAALANVENNGPKAEQLLRKMQHSEDPDCAPSVVSYGTVLAAYKNSPACAEAVDRSESLLFELVYSDRKVGLNTVCFATVLSTMAKRGLAERAEALLERMIQLSNNGRVQDARPNSFVYASLMEGECLCLSRANCVRASLGLWGVPETQKDVLHACSISMGGIQKGRFLQTGLETHEPHGRVGSRGQYKDGS